MHRPIPPFKLIGLNAAICAALMCQSAAFADPSAAPAAADTTAAPVATDSISVFGQGQTRQVENISHADLAKTAPGSSPLEALAQLPGVNFESADTFGAYEWSTELSIRGFNQNQLGFTLDDVPLGDMSYSNWNGLHISRAISSENIGRAELSQGTGALDTASSSNLGGTVRFYSLDPSDQQGATVSQTLGQDNDTRTFLRYDTGRLAFGPKFAISYTNQDSDKWKGSGQDRSTQVNAKMVDIIGESRLSAFMNYSDRKEVDYQDLSKAMVSRLGYNWDNYYPNWNAAINSAKGIWTQGETSMDDAYYAGSGLRRDMLTGATLDAKVSDALRWKTTIYHHEDRGIGQWYTPYVPSSATVPISLRTTEYGINRSGILSALTLQSGMHTIEGGVWLEHNSFDQARRYYALGLSDPGITPYDYPSNPMLTQWYDNFDTNTTVFHLQDTMDLAANLKVNVGFKSMLQQSTATSLIGAPAPESIKASKPFLPQVGMNYKIDQGNEVFASVAQNMRAFEAAATGDSPFATSAAGFSAIQNTLQPETSITAETGWRHHQDGLESLLTVYHVDFRNRLLGVQNGAGIIGNPTILANVGRVETNGVEAALSVVPANDVSWMNSISYNDSQYKNDVVSNGVLYSIAGKEVVDAPKLMFKSELGYDNGAYWGRIDFNYTGQRYYSYTNDASVDGFALWNLSAGYRFKHPTQFVKEADLSLSVNNLFDKQYYSTVGSNGFVWSDPTGTAQTLQVGAPRTAFVTLSAKF